MSAALQEIRKPGFPVELCGATELHAAFREESRTPLLSTSAAAAGNPGSDRPFQGFLPRKTTSRDLYQATVIAKLP
jgi:hypothetical protein